MRTTTSRGCLVVVHKHDESPTSSTVHIFDYPNTEITGGILYCVNNLISMIAIISEVHLFPS